jgi:hypothetical protein
MKPDIPIKVEELSNDPAACYRELQVTALPKGENEI